MPVLPLQQTLSPMLPTISEMLEHRLLYALTPYPPQQHLQAAKSACQIQPTRKLPLQAVN